MQTLGGRFEQVCGVPTCGKVPHVAIEAVDVGSNAPNVKQLEAGVRGVPRVLGPTCAPPPRRVGRACQVSHVALNSVARVARLPWASLFVATWCEVPHVGLVTRSTSRTCQGRAPRRVRRAARDEKKRPLRSLIYWPRGLVEFWTFSRIDARSDLGVEA